MDRISVVLFAGFLFVSAPVAGQIVTNLDPSQIYIPALRFTDPPSGLCSSNSFCMRTNDGVPLSFFAASSDVASLTSQVGALSGQVSSLTRQLQTLDATLGARVDAVNARLDAALTSIAGL